MDFIVFPIVVQFVFAVAALQSFDGPLFANPLNVPFFALAFIVEETCMPPNEGVLAQILNRLMGNGGGITVSPCAPFRNFQIHLFCVVHGLFVGFGRYLSIHFGLDFIHLPFPRFVWFFGAHVNAAVAVSLQRRCGGQPIVGRHRCRRCIAQL